METKDRIKKIRRELDLTQSEFAAQIGATQNTLTGYETGRRNPSASVINNICKTFSVNEEWLRNGDGEMFIQRTEEQEIADIVYELLDPKDDAFYLAVLELVRTYKELTPGSQEVIRESAAKFLDNYKKRKGD